jgi:hypothetical protein
MPCRSTYFKAIDMKKTGILFAAVVLGFLLLSLFLIELQTAEAQRRISLAPTPIPEDFYSYGVNIGSPANTTYSSNSLLLNFTLKRPVSPSDYTFEMLYSLNGEANVTVSSTTAFFDKTTPDSMFSSLASYTIAKGFASLSNLPEGSYFLTVYGIYVHRGPTAGTNWPAIMHDTQTVYFTINDGVPPAITTLQPQNKTYQNSLPLNFSVDEPTSWIGYSLDQKDNVTFSGNTSINGLAYGAHSLAVYANDTVGNMGTTGNINFAIANPQALPSIQALPTLLILSLVTAIMIAIAGLLIYRKRRKPHKKAMPLSVLVKKP